MENRNLCKFRKIFLSYISSPENLGKPLIRRESGYYLEVTVGLRPTWRRLCSKVDSAGLRRLASASSDVKEDNGSKTLMGHGLLITALVPK